VSRTGKTGDKFCLFWQTGRTRNKIYCLQKQGEDGSMSEHGQHASQGDLNLPQVKGLPKAEPHSHGPASKAERWLGRQLLEMSGNPPVKLVLWDGSEITTASRSPHKHLYIHDRRALRRLTMNPEFEFCELYSAGRIDVEDGLVQFMEMLHHAAASAHLRHGLVTGLLPALYRRPRNTLTNARENIHRHYDIGNDFYQLWLDEQMVYTCAYYPGQNESLEQAQVAKFDYVCRKLRLQPGEQVVEAGCGWGALALHMARHYGVKVKAFNISHEQIAYARERLRREGLDDRVEYIEDDYRNITGEFDVFVSVGMLEHVGIDNYGELGTLLDRVLPPEGRGLIHSIGRDRPMLMNPWINRRIFPGAQPPSLGEIMTIFEPNGFSILDIENLRLHYARTLEQWLERYEQAADRVEAMFDPTFVRVWRMYLASSVAAFRAGLMQLFQVVFTRSGNNAIPWTREYLYREND
jgi:cyclopropane-fatty-acyl-phospholipid synthase